MMLPSRLSKVQILMALALLASTAAFATDESSRGISVGPDVTIIDLSGTSNYTSGGGTACPSGYAGSCRGYSIGTNSCNIGSVPVDWCDQTTGCRTTTDGFHPLIATSDDHSVIAQNLYRLKDGRFEQIGMSFLKHGFVSTNSFDSECVWNDGGSPNTSCVQPPAGGDQLGVGCTDFYGSGLNGARSLGRRSDVQAAGADHPPNPAGGETDDAYDQRIVVAETDLDPALNEGALYWAEGHYVVRDDARNGLGHNNASHRAVNVGSMPSLNLSMFGPTIRELPAIYAWQTTDPEVEITVVDRATFFVGEPADAPATGQTHPDYTVRERFHAAWRVSRTNIPGIGSGFRYVYAIHNMNSDTSADGFTVSFPGSADTGVVEIANAGFHDIDHHSGEPYDTTDWTIDIDEPNGRITWSAVDDGVNTNALRWGTMFTFWFDSTSPPVEMAHQLDLFKIDELQGIRFSTPSAAIFTDGFESGNTSRWE